MSKLLPYLFLFASIVSYSQTDYFIRGTDTVYCKTVDYRLTAQSYLKGITYTDLDGKEIVIDGRKNLSGVSTFSINEEIIDKIPQKTNKPKKYVKWAKRVVDGKLKVNYYERSITTYSTKGAVTTTITKFVIKMPDGTFYDIKKKSDRKKHIIPYLQKCEAFNADYRGKYEKHYNDFISMIRLYNALCK